MDVLVALFVKLSHNDMNVACVNNVIFFLNESRQNPLQDNFMALHVFNRF